MSSSDNLTIGMSYGISSIISCIFTKTKPKSVTCDVAKTKIQQKKYHSIIDVRSQFEYKNLY